MSLTSLFTGAARVINAVSGSNVIDTETAGDLGAAIGDGLNIYADVKNNGVSAFATGGSQDLRAYMEGTSYANQYLNSTFMSDLTSSVLGQHMTSAQIQQLLQNTPFLQSASPEIQAQILQLLNNTAAQMAGFGGGTNSVQSALNGVNGGNLASPAGTFGATPGVGAFGANSANSGNMQALKDFLTMKGLPAADIEAAINSPDPSVRMGLWGQMMAFNEQNQKTWLEMLSQLVKVYGDIGESISNKIS